MVPIVQLRHWSTPLARLRASVVIPVRDEVRTLPAALTALADQVDAGGRPLIRNGYEVILLLNNCTDGSLRAAEAAIVRHPALNLRIATVTLDPADAHVGRARRWLMDTACARLESLGRDTGAILSTDADTVVAQDWIAATLREIAAGAEAVGGDIRVAPKVLRDLEPGLREILRQDQTYQTLRCEFIARLEPKPHDPWPRHPHHTGASLAVTARIYRAAGGLPPLPRREDVALWRLLVRLGVRYRHSPDVRVFTSARLAGRATGGMASTLSDWLALADAGGAHRVETAASIERRLVAPTSVKPARTYGEITEEIAELRRRLITLRRAADAEARAGIPVPAAVELPQARRASGQ